MLIYNKKVNEEIKEEVRNTWKQMKMKTQWSKTFEISKSGPKRRVYNNKALPQEVRKNLKLNYPTSWVKVLEKEHQIKPKSNSRKEIIKIRA